MGHVNQRGRNRWEVRVELGRDPLTGRRKRVFVQITGTKKDAQAKLAELERGLATGVYIEPSKLTVADYMRRWLTYMRGRLAPSAYGRYASIVELHIVPRLGSVQLQRLTPAHIVDAEAYWLEHGRVSRERAATHKPLSAKTVLNHHRVLHKALQDAVLVFKVLTVNAADSVQPPRWEKKPIVRLTADEALRLVDVMDTHDLGAALFLMLYTGLRVGEVIGLRWREDVDLARHQIAVQQQWDAYGKQFRDTKSHRSTRPVSLDVDLVAVLRRQKARQSEWRLAAGTVWTDSGLVFTHADGTHLTPTSLLHALDRVLERSGVTSINRHALRHTHATLMLASGAHARVIQERLGHATFAFTMDTYAHLAPGMQDEAAEKFSESLRRRRG